MSKVQLDDNRQLSQKQLDAESERLQMQLDSASARLEEQLRADRQRQDRLEMRGILSEVAVQLMVRWDHIWAIGQEWEAMRADEREGPLPGFRLEALESAYGEEDMTRYWQSLLLILAPDDPLVQGVRKAMLAFRGVIDACSMPAEELDSQAWAEFREQKENFNSGHGAFLTQGRTRFGVSED